MAYSIHICRSIDGIESEPNPITIDDIRKIKTLGEPITGLIAKSPTGEVIEMPDLVRFTYPPNNEKEAVIVFNYHNGQLSFDHKIDEQIELAKLIAFQLNATVQGDEGELYELTKEEKHRYAPKQGIWAFLSRLFK